ncbi:MAG TPA: DnaA N-terminal domain-containing protein, partial [Anaerolineae bacterium]|nr:DnaA N-terminal domain-containing protein [Anaerolineae bacterium]
MKPEQVWQAALGELQLQMSKPTFDTWVRPTRVYSYEDGEFIIAVPKAYMKDWLESKLSSSIKRSLAGIMGRSVDVTFVVFETPLEPQPLLIGLESGESPLAAHPPYGEGVLGNARAPA